MWNQTNKSMKKLKQPTFLISHWSPVEMVHNGPKQCKHKSFFLRLEFFWGIHSGYAIWKLTSRAFWKCNGFPCWDVLNQSYDWSKMAKIYKNRFDPFPPNIHRWKAWILAFICRWAIYLKHPTSRQNFANVVGQNHALILTQCHTMIESTSWQIESKMQ